MKCAVSTWKVQHFNLSVELCELTETQFNSVHRLHHLNSIPNALPNALFAMEQ